MFLLEISSSKVKSKYPLLCLVAEGTGAVDRNDPEIKSGARTVAAVGSRKTWDLKGFSLLFGNRN